MKIIIVTLSILICGIFTVSYPLDTAAVKYYPLAVGNVWTYSGFGYPCCGAFKYRERITGTINTNGHFYYILTKTQSNGSTEIIYIRLDSTKGNIVVNQSGSCAWLQNEKTRDSLAARRGDSSKFDCSLYYRCTDTLTGSYFGFIKKKKSFGWSDFFEAGATRTFAMDFGLVSISSFGHTSTTSVNLQGCYINGILYGDTTLTSIILTSTETPNEFSLSQNYPNPFNPVTKIKFAVSGTSTAQTTLAVYNVLGHEVSVLVNQQLQPGTYEADWDASAYPSGVYYYKLEIRQAGSASGSFTETKKMVLIK
ncbi:MAG: T9SS type A sorting domain-containing protein [Ignavibacteria bacterium]|nr:T9SS type A sorting domain-containing protein [Ignavibacteria bacterium]